MDVATNAIERDVEAGNKHDPDDLAKLKKERGEQQTKYDELEVKWKDERGSNRLDSGTPWYDVYETSDGKWISVGCNEPQFYEAFGVQPGDAMHRADSVRVKIW